MDIKLDAAHDAIFINAPLTRSDVTQPLLETVSQRLKIRLLTFMGEWFLDTRYGVPYWQRILGRKVSKQSVDLIFQENILAEDGVKELVSFSSNYNNRVYSAEFRVKVQSGAVTDTITVTQQIGS